MCRCGTSGYGLVGMVVLGWWLDLILEVISNLILRFYDLPQALPEVMGQYLPAPPQTSIFYHHVQVRTESSLQQDLQGGFPAARH